MTANDTYTTAKAGRFAEGIQAHCGTLGLEPTEWARGQPDARAAIAALAASPSLLARHVAAELDAALAAPNERLAASLLSSPDTRTGGVTP